MIEIQPGLYLLGSKHGWILTGRTSETEPNQSETSMLILNYGDNATNTLVFTSVGEVISREPDLEEFWNVELIGVIGDSTTSNDEKA